MTLPRKPGDPDYLLRRALQLNALFSTLCGLAWIGGGEALGRWFGRDGSMASDGVGLVVFAGLLAILSTRARIPTGLAVIVVALDVLWVLDAGAKVASGEFSGAGSWAMALVALMVLDFAVFQTVGIRQGRRLRQSARA